MQSAEKLAKPAEEINRLAEEVENIIAEKKFSAGIELLEMRWLIGQTLASSPLWGDKKSHSRLIGEIATRCNLRERSIRYCVEFYSRYPNWREFIAAASPENKLPPWRQIVLTLPSGREREKEECSHGETLSLIKCALCGKILGQRSENK